MTVFIRSRTSSEKCKYGFTPPFVQPHLGQKKVAGGVGYCGVMVHREELKVPSLFFISGSLGSNAGSRLGGPDKPDGDISACTHLPSFLERISVTRNHAFPGRGVDN